VPEFRVLSGGEVCRILGDHDFTQVRQCGSHINMQRQDVGGTTTIPVPDHNELRRGTLRSIIRQSRLSRGLFEV
jgi:predicted RNA binding protein YcfA (HicA-like mRNA interferase family)